MTAYSPRKSPGGREKKKLDASFLRKPDFYLVFGIMLFYLCSETSINGWLTSYLKDADLMAAEFAPLMVSLMWMVMIAGRILVAAVSKKISVYKMLLILSAGAAVVYGLFTLTHSPVLIPILILCIGLFLAGIYPTSVSAINRIVDFSAFGMGLAMGGAGVGSIVMPAVTGFVAQNVAMSAGMVCIWVTVVLMLGCAAGRIPPEPEVRGRGRPAERRALRTFIICLQIMAEILLTSWSNRAILL